MAPKSQTGPDNHITTLQKSIVRVTNTETKISVAEGNKDKMEDLTALSGPTAAVEFCFKTCFAAALYLFKKTLQNP